MKYKKITAAFLVMASMLTGCALGEDASLSGNGLSNTEVVSDQLSNGMEHIDSNRQPPIYINYFGYDTNGTKYAYLQDGVEADSFEVVNANSKQTVYTGTIKKNRLMDFSECTQVGTYYILVPYVGMSYEFSIHDTAYESMKVSLMNKLLVEDNYSRADFFTKVQTLQWMVRCTERYQVEVASNALYEESASKEGMIYYNPSFDEDEMDKLWAEMVTIADSLKTDVIELESEPIANTKELASYCALMADMYSLAKTREVKDVNAYFVEASTVYSSLEKNRTQLEDESWLFFAAASMFKNTGQVKYNTYIKSYAKEHGGRKVYQDDATREQLLADEAYVYGQVAYLNATFKADLATCQQFMDELKKEAEQINANHHGNDYMLVAQDHSNRLLTDRAYIVAIMESAIVSVEYIELVEANIQYIGGCNETGLSLFTDRGVYYAAYDQENEDTEFAAAYLYLIGQILEREEIQ